jgi:hypothetical protein
MYENFKMHNSAIKSIAIVGNKEKFVYGKPYKIMKLQELV